MTAKKGQTRRQAMRDLRIEDFKERVTQHGVLTHLVNSVDDIAKLDPTIDSFPNELQQIRAQNEVRYKLLERCVPTLKATEVNLSGQLKVVAIDMTGLEPPDAKT